MSKLAGALAIAVVLTVGALGGTAQAEPGDPPPAANPPAAQNPPPAENPTPGVHPNPGTSPGASPASTTPTTRPPVAPEPPAGPTPTSRPPVVRPSTRVMVSPSSGRAGTTVTVVADVRGTCDPAWTFFQDRRQVGSINTTRPVTFSRFNGRRLVASYTVSSRDAAGWGRFGVSCDMRSDTYRVDYASFRVLPARSGAVTGTRDNGNRDGGRAAPLPDLAGPGQAGTELGGTAAGGGLDPTWLLVPTALLLVVLALVLRLLHTARLQH